VKAIGARLGSLFSDPNPILVKELRATFRTALFVRFLYLCTGLVGLVVLGVGAAIASGEVPPAEVGQIVFQLFMGAALLVLSLVAPGYASACVTSEKEQQTWESLELSGMSPSRIVIGKFAACYASIALVLIALSPVVGIAFLFGGVSPWQVLVGFVSLLVVLAPAIATGVALSARLGSTRLAIVLATVFYFPIALGVTTMMAAFGDEARHSWGTSMEGPFFYAEALVTRADKWDTWALVVGVPLYAYGMTVWFLLASAVAGVRPAAEDRSRALKIWAVAMTISSAIAGVVTVAAQSGARESEQFVLVVAVCTSVLLLFYGFVFTNEPPLAPRPWEVRRATQPAWKRALGVLGPGAAGTLRFTILLMFFSAVLIIGVAAATHYTLHPARLRSEEVYAAGVLGLGAAIVASFVAALGAWLRIALRHGLAARVLSLSVVLALAILPFLVALVISPDSLDDLDDVSPFPIRFSVLEPLMIAIQMVDGRYDEYAAAGIVFPAATYGLFATAFVVLVETRVISARRASAKRRERFAEDDKKAAEEERAEQAAKAQASAPASEGDAPP
jgi:ABC-type transport system involved in multi-copper enzyme maturation permease subunit